MIGCIDEGSNDEWNKAWKIAIKLMKNIQTICIDDGYGFDNSICKILFDKNMCPKLEYLWIKEVMASNDVIKLLKQKRKNINIKMYYSTELINEYQ